MGTVYEGKFIDIILKDERLKSLESCFNMMGHVFEGVCQTGDEIGIKKLEEALSSVARSELARLKIMDSKKEKGEE
jgi:hypothetical protein